MAATLEITAKEDVSEKLFKLEQQNLRLIESNKRLAQESKKGTQEAKTGFDHLDATMSRGISTAQSMAATIIGIGSAAAVVGQLKTAYSDWLQTIQKLGEAHHKFAEDLVKDLARGTNAANATEIASFLKRVPGVKPDEARQLFAGVQAAAPWADLEQQKAQTVAAAGAAVLQQGRLGEFGTLVSKVGQMAPGRSAEATAGLALKLQQLAGQHIEQLAGDKFMRAVSTLKAAGVPEEDAMAQMLVALEKGQGRPGALISAAEAIDKQMEPIKTSRGKRVLTAEDQANNRFAAADRGERLRLLQTDKAVREAVLGDQAIMYGQIDPTRVAARAGELRDAQAGGFIAGQIQQIAASPEGAEVVVGRRRALRKYVAEAGDREVGEALNRAEDRFDTSQAGRPFYDRWARRIKWGIAKFIDPRNPEAAYEDLSPVRGVDEKSRTMIKDAGSEEAQIDRAETIARILEKIERNTRGPNPGSVQGSVNQHAEK